jgi:replicative DNA helicase
MPGEVVMIVGDTSQGKTAIMQAIMISAKPKPTLMFELELPLDAMFTRSVQMQRGCYESDIIKGYKENPKGRYADNFDKLQHIMICPQSGLTMDDVERYIIKSELKFGGRPNLVFVDYMGLVRKDRTFSRYEAMAYSAEQCKVIAKRTNTIVFIGSQVARPASSKEHVKDVQIHHAKGAGELENSSNLVLGISRPEERILRMKVLKNTRGPIGAELEFDFDPGKMQITEKVDTGPAVVKASHWESAKE